MSIRYDLTDGHVSLDGTGLLRYSDVKEALEYNGRLILLLSKGRPGEESRNCLALTPEGHELWTIQEAPGSDGASPYTSVFIEDGNLLAYNWNGFSYFIDPHTGKIAVQKYLK